jgi:hypothetical protein
METFLLRYIFCTTSMSREIHLIVYAGNDPKPVYWAVWIPDPNKQGQGKLIHVTGNTARWTGSSSMIN